MTIELYVTLSRYNTWMNEKLYAVCATMPEDERKADKGAFFRSVHGTLNHILLADRAWIGRFEGVPESFPSLDHELFDDWDELRENRQATDTRIVAYIARVTPEMLAAPLVYRNFKGEEMSRPLWVLVSHLFNHATHHRGQLTTLMEQMGYDSGVTDLPYLPYLPDAPGS